MAHLDFSIAEEILVRAQASPTNWVVWFFKGLRVLWCFNPHPCCHLRWCHPNTAPRGDLAPQFGSSWLNVYPNITQPLQSRENEGGRCFLVLSAQWVTQACPCPRPIPDVLEEATIHLADDRAAYRGPFSPSFNKVWFVLLNRAGRGKGRINPSKVGFFFPLNLAGVY